MISNNHLYGRGDSYWGTAEKMGEILYTLKILSVGKTSNSFPKYVLLCVLRFLLAVAHIEVYAGFEPAHSEDELPCFSYGIKYVRKDETIRVHVFKTSADGCLASDMANNRRKSSLNVVIAIAEDIIRQVYHCPEDVAKIDISIRTDMDIDGFYCPDGWYVKNRPNSN